VQEGVLSVAIANEPGTIMTDEMLIAHVAKVGETRHGQKVWLTVLRGELAEGDEVLATHPDGTQESLRLVDVGKRPVKLGGHGPYHQKGVAEGTYRRGDMLRARGGPPVELDPSSALAKEIEGARSAGLNASEPYLPDEIIALLVQDALNNAASQKGLQTAVTYYGIASSILDGYGLRESADRAMLVAASLEEGYTPSVSSRALASLGASAILAPPSGTPFMVSALGYAVEEGEAFNFGYKRGLASSGAAKRKQLMADSRAIALGWCTKCGDIESLDDKLQCQVCHRKSERFRVVIPADRELAEQELRDEGPPRKHGLFGH
jgi:hypothetical protein